MTERLINETDTVVALPAYEKDGEVFAILPTGLIALDDITSAHLNHYAVVTTLAHANAGAGGNISCAISSDAFNLGFTDSNEDDEKTLCDAGNSVDLTDKNYEGDISTFMDKDFDSTTSNFAMAEHLVFRADVPYILAWRVGYASNVPFASGHEVEFFYVHTDHPVAVYADGSSQKVQQVYIPKGESRQARVLTA